MKKFDDEPGDIDDAIQMWETFNQLDWNVLGEFAPSLRIPERLVILGDADYVMYRSKKRDPESGRVPKRALDYIHKHGAQVRIAVPSSSGLRQGASKTVATPDFIRKATSLARLGECLGFAYSSRGEQFEIEGTRPLPELYAIASGKALLVIDGKCKLEAIIWGGRLDVEARGIVH